jgi:hypothetical protein
MTSFRPDRRFILRASVLAAAGLGLAGCESLQDIPAMFERKPAPLAGDRQPVFPQGVPGIDRGVQQPANAPSQAAPAEAPAQQPAEEQPTRRRRRTNSAG